MSLKGNDKIILRYKGWPTAFFTTEIVSLEVSNDTEAPRILSSIDANTLTNQSSIQITIQDSSQTNTEITIEGVTSVLTPSKNISVPLNPGQQMVFISSTDSKGNRADLDLGVITLDQDSPQIDLSIGPQNPHYQRSDSTDPLVFSFQSSEPLSSFTSSLGDTVPLNDNMFQVSFLPLPGVSTLSVSGFDLAGNQSTRILSQAVFFDDYEPTLNIDGIPAVVTSPSILAIISVGDQSPTKTRLYLNSNLIDTIDEKTFSYNISLPENQIFSTIEIQTTDAAGNLSEQKVFNVQRVNGLAELTISNPPEGSLERRQRFLVSGSIKGEFSELRVNGNEIPIQNVIDDTSYFEIDYENVNNGPQSLSFTFMNALGELISVQRSYTGVVDTNSPVIIGNISEGTTFQKNLAIQVTDENLEIAEIYLDGNFIGSLNEAGLFEYLNESEGQHTYTVTARDYYGNENQVSGSYFLDFTPPLLTAFGQDLITKELEIPFDYMFWDLTPAKILAYVNGELKIESTEMQGQLLIPLEQEGRNRVSVLVMDEAGNTSDPIVFEAKRITLPPTLTIVEPYENELIDGYDLLVKVQTTDELKSLKIGDRDFAWNPTTGYWQTGVQAPRSGLFTIEVTGVGLTDISGSDAVTVQIVEKVIVPELIGLFPDPSTGMVLIKGAVGSTRPLQDVNISSGFFTGTTVTSDSKGQFHVLLGYSDSFQISAFDNILNREIVFELQNGVRQQLLSGVVRDHQNSPLAGVILRLQNFNLEAVSDDQGNFNFSASEINALGISGEQVLQIDGGMARNPDSTTPRRFNSTTLLVNLSANQNNVLQTPVYLAPVFLDGSATEVEYFAGGIVNDVHAPGYAIDIPGSAVQFPDSAPSAKISLVEVDAEFVTVPPPPGVNPRKILMLEPSGTSFNQSVSLTLPNGNNLPPSSEAVIMLMNSKTGKWEVGGMGQVSSDGNSVQSLPNMGIRHFSQAFVLPPPPDVIAKNVPSLPGADSFSGALTRSLTLPGFKILGADQVPSLIYKTSWANPSTTITNVFNFSEKIAIADPVVVSGTDVVEYKVYEIKCYPDSGLLTNVPGAIALELNRQLDPGGYHRRIAAMQGTGETKNPPADTERCKYTSKDLMSIVDYTSTLTNLVSEVKPKQIDFQFSVANIQTPKKSFGGESLPKMAVVSEFVELKDSSANFLASGVYPYRAEYTITYDQITTGSISTSTVINGIPTDPKSEKTEAYSDEQKDKLFGRTLSESLFVQNYRDSEIGAGWKLGLTQKIVNPNSNRLMVEEADGSIATYSSQAKIESVVDLSSFDIDSNAGFNLSTWPQIFFTKQTGEILELGSPTSTNPLVKGKQVDVTGRIEGSTFFNYTEQVLTGYHEECQGGLVNLGGGCVFPIYTPVYIYPEYSACRTDSYDYYQTTKPSAFVIEGGKITAVDGQRDNLFELNSGAPQVKVGNYSTNVPEAIGYLTSGGQPGQAITFTHHDRVFNELSFIIDNSLPFTKIPGRNDSRVPGHNACGPVPQSSGAVYLSSNAWAPGNSASGFNNPMDIAKLPGTDSYLIADHGNSRILRWSNINGIEGIFMGTGDASDGPSGELASSTAINGPRVLTVDNQGNVFVGTESGLVRKISSDGRVQTVIGNVLSEGSYYEGPALGMKLDRPTGLLVDNLGTTLYVSDTGYNRVVKVDLVTGFASTIAGDGDAGFEGDSGPAASAKLNGPRNLAFDENGDLLVFDAGNARVRRIKIQSTSETTLFLADTKDNSVIEKSPAGDFTRIYRSGVRNTFGSSGVQTASSDRVGNTTQFNYSNGKLDQVVLPDSSSLTISYSGEKISSITDPAGRTTHFEHTSDGKLSEVEFPDGTFKNYLYHDNNIMYAERDQKNAVTQFVYNSYQRLEQIILPDDSVLEIQDSASKSLENQGGGIFTPLSANLSASGANETIIDPNGNSIQLVKNNLGYISTVKDPDGRIQTIQRDLQGRPIKTTDFNGTITETTYDQFTGDVVSVKNVTRNLTKSFTYDSFGQILSETDFKNRVTTRVFNSQGLLISQTEPTGTVTEFTYNSRGQPLTKRVQVAFHPDQITSFSYNAKGQISSVTDSDGKSKTFTYDLAGNVISESVQNGAGTATTYYEFDLSNRLTKVTSAKGEVTQYSYSPTGELLSIVDPKNQTTTFAYDLKGQVISKTDSFGKTTTMGYDGNGNLVQEVDPNGNNKSFQYDASNRLLKATFPDDVFDYVYSPDKKEIVETKNNISRVAYTRGLEGRIEGTTVTGLGALGNYPVVEFGYTYDQDGILTGVNAPTIGGVTFERDAFDRITAIRSNIGDVTYEIDPLNRVAALYRQVQGEGPGNYTQFVYTTNNLISSISHLQSSTQFGFTSYVYNTRNLPIQKSTSLGITDYTYDENGQLSSAIQSGGALPGRNPASNLSESFSYDSLGNRTQDSGGSYNYDPTGQRLTEDYRYTYQYDNNGNLTSKTPKTAGEKAIQYVYNSRNQLIEYREYTNAFGSMTKQVKYFYDAQNRRMKKEVFDFENSSNNLGKFYVYSGENIFAEYDNAGNLLLQHLHSPNAPDDILATHVYTDGASAGLAQAPGTYWYHKDALGTVTEMTYASGNLAQRLEYTSFGKLLSVRSDDGSDISANPAFKNTFAFTGREIDYESGLMYYRARYYDPQIGRFLQQDPDPGDLTNPITVKNRYAYAGNNPIIFKDPSGKIFGWDDLLYVLYIGVVSAVQAEYQVHNGGDSDFNKNFWNNFGVNLLASFVGFLGSDGYSMGPFGGYSEIANSTKRGYSIGFFQNTGGGGFLESAYWHEVGHTINFFISGLSWRGDFSQRLGSAAGFYAINGFGSLVLPRINPVTTITEGGADIWSAPWFKFEHLREYQPWW